MTANSSRASRVSLASAVRQTRRLISELADLSRSADYAMIGSLRTAAMISLTGSIDSFCMPVGRPTSRSAAAPLERS